MFSASESYELLQQKEDQRNLDYLPWLPGVRSSSALSGLVKASAYEKTFEAITRGLEEIAEEASYGTALMFEQDRHLSNIALSLSAPNLSAVAALQLPEWSEPAEESTCSLAEMPPADKRTSPPNAKDQFYKTKLCIPFLSGHCRRSKTCW